MEKRLSAFFLVLIILCSMAFADSSDAFSVKFISQESDFDRTMPVIVDTVTAALVANYGKTKVDLPSMAISSSETGLPTRISFFLADPASFTKNISKALGVDNTSFFSNLFSSFSSTVSDPMLSAVYYNLMSKNYQRGEYLISGTILVDFPDYLDNLTLEEILVSELNDENPVILKTNLRVYGSRLAEPVRMAGEFILTVEEKTHVVVRPVNEYIINNDIVSGGEFRF